MLIVTFFILDVLQRIDRPSANMGNFNTIYRLVKLTCSAAHAIL